MRASLAEGGDLATRCLCIVRRGYPSPCFEGAGNDRRIRVTQPIGERGKRNSPVLQHRLNFQLPLLLDQQTE